MKNSEHARARAREDGTPPRTRTAESSTKLTRRAMLITSASAISAAAVPSIAEGASDTANARLLLSGGASSTAAVVAKEVDPIFAAIERHRDASAAWYSAYDRRLAEAPQLGDYDDEPEMIALSDASCAALDALAEVVPSSIAGAAALVCYVADCHARGDKLFLNYVGDDDHHFGELFLENAAAGLRHITQVA